MLRNSYTANSKHQNFQFILFWFAQFYLGWSHVSLSVHSVFSKKSDFHIMRFGYLDQNVL